MSIRVLYGIWDQESDAELDEAYFDLSEGAYGSDLPTFTVWFDDPDATPHDLKPGQCYVVTVDDSGTGAMIGEAPLGDPQKPCSITYRPMTLVEKIDMGYEGFEEAFEDDEDDWEDDEDDEDWDDLEQEED